MIFKYYAWASYGSLSRKEQYVAILEIANFWIEDYKRFRSSMLAIRSIIVVFVLFCWKTSKKLQLTLERKKKAGLRQFFLIKSALKSKLRSTI